MDRVRKKIPVKYLQEIGVKLNVLKFTVELDREEYKEAL